MKQLLIIPIILFLQFCGTPRQPMFEQNMNALSLKRYEDCKKHYDNCVFITMVNSDYSVIYEGERYYPQDPEDLGEYRYQLVRVYPDEENPNCVILHLAGDNEEFLTTAKRKNKDE